MKCAKCGRDVPQNSPTCPWCAAGFKYEVPRQENKVRCPQCGSSDISAVRRNYSPGCGCLGLLLFGWIGLLMGLLGAGKVDLVCRNCGTQWEAVFRKLVWLFLLFFFPFNINIRLLYLFPYKPFYITWHTI